MPSKTCEVCGEERPLVYYNAMMMCASCVQSDIEHDKEREATADDRVEAMKIDMLSRQVQIDTSIKVDTDLFNAATVSIVDMKQAIDEDESITNKKYELATRLVERHKHFQEIIFQLNKQQAEAASAQRSIQTYLNELANKLREDEREKLRLSDLSYKPKPVAKPKKAKVPKKKKYDKAELAKAAETSGLAVSTIQTICTAQDMQPMEAAEFLLNSMKKAAANG